tara:strand:+ start:4084 stop:4932 length:849 start_codon:yes stop_codon:yes gene_type:complete
MFEKLSSFFDEAWQRIRNPFLFSFILALCLYNYRITLALFLWDGTFKHLLDFICDEARINGVYIWAALGSATAYSVLFPVLQNLISAWKAFSIDWGNKWNFNISKESPVSMETYFNFRKNYKEQQENLATIISEEQNISNLLTDTQSELSTSNRQIAELNTKLGEKEAELERFKNTVFNLSMLNGYWQMTVVIEKQTPIEEIVRVSFEDGRFSIFDQGGTKQFYAFIENFSLNEREEKVFFVKRRREYPDQDIYQICNFKYSNNGKKLVGTEDDNSVVYIRE